MLRCLCNFPIQLNLKSWTPLSEPDPLRVEMSRLQEHEHWLMLLWLSINGLIAFGLIVSWNEGFLQTLLTHDKSRISLAIGLLYIIGTAHCARRISYLSVEIDYVYRIRHALNDKTSETRFDNGAISISGETVRPHSILGSHLIETLRNTGETNNAPSNLKTSPLVDVLVSRVKGPHDIGWFGVDILLKLGLIGTIVGFILMLGSVANAASLDVNTMQKILTQMSAGMGTALLTTLTGLIGSILLGLQYLLLDKGADSLIENIICLTESLAENR